MLNSRCPPLPSACNSAAQLHHCKSGVALVCTCIATDGKVTLVWCLPCNCTSLRCQHCQICQSQVGLHSHQMHNKCIGPTTMPESLPEVNTTLYMLAMCTVKRFTEQNELYWTENPTNRVSCSRRGRVLNNDELVLMKLVKVWCYHDLVFLRTYPNKLQIILRIVLADLLDGASCLHCEVGDQ